MHHDNWTDGKKLSIKARVVWDTVSSHPCTSTEGSGGKVTSERPVWWPQANRSGRLGRGWGFCQAYTWRQVGESGRKLRILAKRFELSKGSLLLLLLLLLFRVLTFHFQSEYMMESCKVALTFESVEEVPWCDIPIQTSSAVLSHRAICVFGILQNKNWKIGPFGNEMKVGCEVSRTWW